MLSNLPTESISNITEGLLDARFGGTFGHSAVFRDTTTGKLVPSQLLSRRFFDRGQQYGGVVTL